MENEDTVGIFTSLLGQVYVESPTPLPSLKVRGGLMTGSSIYFVLTSSFAAREMVRPTVLRAEVRQRVWSGNNSLPFLITKQPE